MQSHQRLEIVRSAAHQQSSAAGGGGGIVGSISDQQSRVAPSRRGSDALQIIVSVEFHRHQILKFALQ